MSELMMKSNADETGQPRSRGDGDAVVEVVGVSKEFIHRTSGDAFLALQNIDLKLKANEVVCLVGASGCGKSTILNLIAGFEEPTNGEILIDGRKISRPGPDRGVVFQDHGLFPWLSVADNVRFGPRARGITVSVADVQEILDLVGVGEFASSYPHELSGGMRQRVAIARTLINEPRILLMDEPFGALDALTRLKMQELLAGIVAQRPCTVLFITHDIEEALLLGDRVIVMTPRPGTFQQEFRLEEPRPRTLESLDAPELIAHRRKITNLLMK